MTRMRRRSFVVRAASVVATVPWMGCGSGDSGDGAAGSSTSSGGTESADPSVASSSGASEGASQGTTGSTGGSGGGPTDGSGASTSGEGGSSGETAAETTTATDDSTGAAACDPSPEDIEGPFYREGIPVGSNLDVHGDPGLPLLLDGRVLDEACAPLAGAVVEIWHATPRAPGAEPGDADATYDSSATYRYYGQVATDERGAYAFETLRPGWYLNGAQYRPAHVHVKVWVNGVERLTTQLYFDDDPFNRDDPWFNPVMSLAPDEGGHATLDLVV